MIEKISILLASYNGEKYIKEQLDSIIFQKLSSKKKFKIQILIYDDQSTDNTVKILQDYQKINPELIHIIPTKPYKLGVNGSFEFLLENCAFETLNDCIFFSDQDDIWFDDKIQKYLDFYHNIKEKNKPVLIYSDPIVWDGKNILHQSMMKHLRIHPLKKDENPFFFQNIITGHTVMINHHLKLLLLPFTKDILIYDWFMAIMAYYSQGLYFLPTQHSYYRQHNNNVIGAKGKKNLFNIKYLIEKYNQSLAQFTTCIQRSNHTELKNSGKELMLMMQKKGLFCLRYFYKNKLFPQSFIKSIPLIFIILFYKDSKK